MNNRPPGGISLGDRIVIQLTDGERFAPDFYGHWCGLRAVKVMNDLCRGREDNGINSMMCNFIVTVMDGTPQRYSYYLYSHGETDGMADWDNYTWRLNVSSGRWITTDPRVGKESLTLDEADAYVRCARPSLYENDPEG